MKALNVKNMGKAAAQQGFTIIELVVVILLLGILTATALPRFMDVTDEAHDAVVDAVRGGLLTGGALFRAQYIGTGEPLGAAVTGFGAGNLWADVSATPSGYPADATDGEINDEDDCEDVYIGLLQAGRPLATTAAAGASAAATEAAVEAAAAATLGADFVISTVDQADPTTACVLYYVGQFRSGNPTTDGFIPTLTYTLSSGEVLETTTTFDQ